MTKTLNVLVIVPHCDGSDVGEAWCAHMWVSELAKRANVTLITQQRPGRIALEQQLPNVRIIARQEPAWALKFPRLNAMAKLSYPGFYFWAKRQIHTLLKNEEHFDVAHQFSPLALRFPTPLMAFNIPYVLGPLGGSLSTPSAFKKECGSAAWFTRLRTFDRLRLAWDPFLKRSYHKASAVLGVAPYVGTLLENAHLTRFDIESELGLSSLHSQKHQPDGSQKGLRLLHVGRGVRSKGLRDCIRALANLEDLDGIHLDVAGSGEEMPICKALATKLGVRDRITFHGQIDRKEVDHLYEQADVFCFPSFREPSGSVIFEAMSYGIPVITADRGGPGHVIDDSCGVKVAVTDTKEYPKNIALAVRALALMPGLRQTLSDGALVKMSTIAMWPEKISRLLKLYQEIRQ
ncbi:MAG: glycosyltransferase [Kordiimonadaceae bacterium]|nr:glycosyltransferase [Kordiimonadaceae bacterium]